MPLNSVNNPVGHARKLCTAVISRETIVIHLSTLSELCNTSKGQRNSKSEMVVKEEKTGHSNLHWNPASQLQRKGVYSRFGWDSEAPWREHFALFFIIIWQTFIWADDDIWQKVVCGVIPYSSAAFLITMNNGVGLERTKPLAFATSEKKNCVIYEFSWVIFSNTGKNQKM